MLRISYRTARHANYSLGHRVVCQHRYQDFARCGIGLSCWRENPMNSRRHFKSHWKDLLASQVTAEDARKRMEEAKADESQNLALIFLRRHHRQLAVHVFVSSQRLPPTPLSFRRDLLRGDDRCTVMFRPMVSALPEAQSPSCQPPRMPVPPPALPSLMGAIASRRGRDRSVVITAC